MGSDDLHFFIGNGNDLEMIIVFPCANPGLRAARLHGLGSRYPKIPQFDISFLEKRFPGAKQILPGF